MFGMIDDAQLKMLELGHERWVVQAIQQGVSPAQAEEQFAVALGTQNWKLAHDQKSKDLIILFANISKGAARIGDYARQHSTDSRSETMRAEVASGLAARGFLLKQPFASPPEQILVWSDFRTYREVHLSQYQAITDFAQSRGGFSFPTVMNAYDDLGNLFSKTIKLVERESPDRKAWIFDYFRRMLRFSAGKDALSP